MPRAKAVPQYREQSWANPPDPQHVAALGELHLPAGMAEEIAEMIGEVLAFSDRPSSAQTVQGLDAITDAAKTLKAALAAMGADVKGAIDLGHFIAFGEHDLKLVGRLGRDLSFMAHAIEAAREVHSRRRPPTGADVQSRLASRLAEIFERYELPFDRSKRHLGAPTLAAVLKLAGHDGKNAEGLIRKVNAERGKSGNNNRP